MQPALNISNNTPQPYTFKFTEGERRVFRQKEKITVSQWAERHRIVTNGPMPGKWSNKVTPFAVEPMDCWNLPWVREIILCFAPQVVKTQIAFNCLCYSIDQDPGPAMYIMPDEKVTKRISRRRIIPMFRATPRIAELMSPRFDDTTTLAVQFQNGMDLMMAWATSAAELSSESVRYLFFDETDKYPDFAGKEADPISLGEIRTNAYPHTKKVLYLSTPGPEPSTITRLMEKRADEVREYHVPCPVCGELQKMDFENIVWPENIRDPRIIERKKLAHYSCKKCGMYWDDYMRDEAVRHGKWVSNNPVDRPAAVAFYLPSWYSSFISLSVVAAAFVRGQEDPSKLMVFVTQHQAREWKETIEPKKESGILENKTDIPPGIVPKGAIALTCGFDAQKHGFWFVVRAWAEDLTNWLVQYGYLATFADVEALVFETRYQVQDSNETMGIWRAAIDTGGGESSDDDWTRTEEIYQWIRKNGRGVVFGIKGASKPQLKRVQIRVIDKMTRGNRPIPGGLELRFLDTAQFKDLIHWRISRKEGENQRFFLHSETGIDYARQILAEEKRRDRRRKVKWVQTRRDNHLLDAEVYAAACADPEWLPSLSMLAVHLKARKEKIESRTPTAPLGTFPTSPVEKFKRPGWLDRR